MCSLFREKKKRNKSRCVFARTEHKEISCRKLTNEGEGRFFWDTSEAIWVMKQMCMLHIRQLNSWLESGLLPHLPSDTLQTEENYGKIRGGLAKDRKAASAFPGWHHPSAEQGYPPLQVG